MMKITSLFVSTMFSLSLSASDARTTELPSPEFADTEVSTNLPFAFSLDAASRIEFTLSLDASPTNTVEVSIGADENADGNLSLDETDCTIGYRCGKWFVRDAVADVETVTDETQSGRLDRMFKLRKRKINPASDLVKVTRRGVAAIGEVVVVEGKLPGLGVMVR